jgi:drug/metabolite transporter (DMT)-like permease
MASSTRGTAFIAMGFTVLIWAYSWVVMKQVLGYIGPFDFVALRYALGTVILFGALLATRTTLQPPPLGPTILVGLMQTAAFQGLGQLALVSGGAGHVALLAYAMPFWAVLLAWVILAERPRREQWLGIALAAIGLVCVIEPWHGVGSPLSTALALGGGVCWAVATVVSKRLFRDHGTSPLSLTAWQMAFGALALVIVTALVPQRTIDWSPTLLGCLAYSVLLATAVAWGLWAIVVKRLPTAVSSLSSLAIPVVSVLLAWAVLGERPTVMEGVGMVLIMAGLLAVTGVLKRR